MVTVLKVSEALGLKSSFQAVACLSRGLLTEGSKAA